MVYLNEGTFTGGGTLFPHANIVVQPEVGKMVLWRNVGPGGELLDPIARHCGLPVEGVGPSPAVKVRDHRGSK